YGRTWQVFHRQGSGWQHRADFCQIGRQPLRVYSSPKPFVDDKRRSCFDSTLRATLSTNGIPVRRERTVRPERSGAKSKGEPPQIKKDSYIESIESIEFVESIRPQ